MTGDEKRARIEEIYEGDELLFADGFDDCIIGVVEICSSEPRVLYDTAGVTKKLQEDGMSEEEAIEYFYYNIAGAYVGEHTPGFVMPIEEL